MVLKSKGGKKYGSSIGKKNKKSDIKYNRKTNYKKKSEIKKTCCVCMEEVPDTTNNTITCGKINHTLCSECKPKCKECPMCRSHPINLPKDQEFSLKINSRSCKHQSQHPKKRISVNVTHYDRKIWEFVTNNWSGEYHEIRKDSRNYPIFKKIDEEKYIVQLPRAYKGDNSCTWAFQKCPDNNYDSHWVFKDGKLIGHHDWFRYRYHNSSKDSKYYYSKIPVKINIARIK